MIFYRNFKLERIKLSLSRWFSDKILHSGSFSVQLTSKNFYDDKNVQFRIRVGFFIQVASQVYPSKRGSPLAVRIQSLDSRQSWQDYKVIFWWRRSLCDKPHCYVQFIGKLISKGGTPKVGAKLIMMSIHKHDHAQLGLKYNTAIEMLRLDYILHSSINELWRDTVWVIRY